MYGCPRLNGPGAKPFNSVHLDYNAVTSGPLALAGAMP
jgi:hypothetical protein